jgi:hypothetical protein
VTAAEIAGLPPVVRRYLHAMGVLDRPRLVVPGALRRAFPAEGAGFLDARRDLAVQHAVEVARFFHMRIDFAGVVPMVGRDIYLRGKGMMHGKLLGVVTVARSEGSETDLSELVTFLNDAVLLAPSMLLRLKASFAGGRPYF